MSVENDPKFWEWLREQQKDRNTQKDNEEVFERLVLELPIPHSQKKKKHPEHREEDSSETELDIHGDDYVIFEL